MAQHLSSVSLLLIIDVANGYIETKLFKVAASRKEHTMFNIRLRKGAFVTKSIIPTNKPTLNILRANEEINSLKQQLAEAKGQPTTQTPSTEPTQPFDLKKVQEALAAIPSAESRIEAQRSFEQEALSSHKNIEHRSNGVRVRHFPNKPILPTGAPNQIVAEMISQASEKRLQNGQEPFYTYQQFLDEPAKRAAFEVADAKARGHEYVHVSELAPKPVSTAPHFISKWSYYVCFHNGVCYYQEGTWPSILKRIDSVNMDGSTISTHKSIAGASSEKYRNISQTEYNAIVAKSPAPEELFKVYRKWQNVDDVRINTSAAIAVF